MVKWFIFKIDDSRCDCVVSGSAACPKEGTTNLHLDMSDAVNIMVSNIAPSKEKHGHIEKGSVVPF